MRAFLKFLVGPRSAWLPAMLMVFWALFILPAGLWALGVFATTGFGEAEQIALSRDLGSSNPIEAIAAAQLVSADFGSQMQDAIEASSETFDRSRTLDPSAAALETGDAARRGWVQRHVCDLEGWGDYRPLVRTLMLNGLGKCPFEARLRARSPILDGAPPVAAWLIVCLIALMLIVPPLLAFLLWKVRSAYQWLYSSSVITAQPPLATS
jgi:hypothetical protein